MVSGESGVRHETWDARRDHRSRGSGHLPPIIMNVALKKPCAEGDLHLLSALGFKLLAHNDEL